MSTRPAEPIHPIDDQQYRVLLISMRLAHSTMRQQLWDLRDAILSGDSSDLLLQHVDEVISTLDTTQKATR